MIRKRRRQEKIHERKCRKTEKEGVGKQKENVCMTKENAKGNQIAKEMKRRVITRQNTTRDTNPNKKENKKTTKKRNPNPPTQLSADMAGARRGGQGEYTASLPTKRGRSDNEVSPVPSALNLFPLSLAFPTARILGGC